MAPVALAAIAPAPRPPANPARAAPRELAAFAPARASRTAKAHPPRFKRRKATVAPEPVETDSDVALLTALIEFGGNPGHAATPGADAGPACVGPGAHEPGKKCITRAAKLLHVMRKTTD
ncbi:hypothetical protein C7C56_010285 [Massilia glaciei]|uniref:Uncharacterized protein n=1 Tax=Massilia glaciei TaxID=1524097 RepID=A0A2U2HMI7_9BURK|nr:hypothetical protein C7C56_010285 [Massilia glaciei]